MKLIHLSDLHLGKRLNEFSLIEDQKYILRTIIKIIDDERPDCVVIAGDIYDKSFPSTEATVLFDDFLVRLSKRNIRVFVISGNHDSPERLAFGNRLIDASGIHISPVYNGDVKPFVIEDEYGKVNIYMLPFIKPAHVRAAFPEENIESYTDAVRLAVEKMNIDTAKRNILVAHQFVTGAARSDSEEISVGGLDNIDGSVFSAFDYVALGHIHTAQTVISPNIRYCGTPLKYSFSEAAFGKSVSVVTLREKGSLDIDTVDLTPYRDLIEIRGTYDMLTAKSYYDKIARDSYIRVILTDEEDIPDAVSKLRVIYPNLMKLDYDNTRTRHRAVCTEGALTEEKTPLELFSEFYEKQNGCGMTGEQESFIKELIEKIWEDEQ